MPNVSTSTLVRPKDHHLRAAHLLVAPLVGVSVVALPLRFAATSEQARAAIALYFRNNGHLKDPRVVDALVMKGYMDLEETTMQVRTFRLKAGNYELSFGRIQARKGIELSQLRP